MELNEIRQEIDAINRQMQSLFERRMELCGKVAEYKGAHSMKIFVPEREEAILSAVRKQASPAFAEYDVEFFRCLLALSRTYQGALLGLDPQKTAVAERYETEHLLLRPLKREDLPPVFSLTSDPEVTRYLRFDTHTDPMEALVLIDELTSGGNYGYLVTSKEGGCFIGVFALKADEKDPTSANLTVFLSRSFWNRGYAGELLAFAKKKAPELSFKTLRAWVADGNAGSRRALEKAGFTVEQRLTFRGIDGGLTTYVFPLKPEKA